MPWPSPQPLEKSVVLGYNIGQKGVLQNDKGRHIDMRVDISCAVRSDFPLPFDTAQKDYDFAVDIEAHSLEIVCNYLEDVEEKRC